MKREYTSPTLTVVSFRVENGFTGSSPDPVSCFELFLNDEGSGDLNQAASFEPYDWNW